MEEQLDGWPVKVSRKKRKQAKQATPPVAALSNEVDLDLMLKKNPRLKNISRHHLLKALRRMPQELVCGDNEILCLVDSGSTINAAWIEKHFPAYFEYVKTKGNAGEDRTATTACGKILHEKGRCTVFGKIAGSQTSIDFRDMEVEMPILSVRKMIKKRNLVQFEDDGGFIKNQDTGRTTKFYECDGAYFLKLRIDDPSVAEQWLGRGLPEPARSSNGKGSGSSFPRPGQ